MILEENIIQYFNDMKSRGAIGERWQYKSFVFKTDNSIMIYYEIISTKDSRRSSFKTTYDVIIRHLRDQKLKNILE